MTTFSEFLARFGLDLRCAKSSVLSLPCPLCHTGRVTARPGLSGEVRLSCSSGCHAAGSGHGAANLLHALEQQRTAAAALQIEIGVNRHVVGKLPPDTPGDVWRQVNRGFVTQRLDAAGLAQVIQAGHAITAVHRNGERKRSNFVSAQHIGLDFDTGDRHSSLDGLLEHPLIRRYAALLHTTASHTPAHPRARVIFFLDQPVKNELLYRRLIHALLSHFPHADPACIDASRLWYGAPGCELRLLGQVLPLKRLQSLAGKPAASLSASAAPHPDAVDQAARSGIIAAGERNTTLTRIAGSHRRRGWDEARIAAALLEVNRLRCRPPLPEAEVQAIARSVAGYPPGQFRDHSLQPPLQSHPEHDFGAGRGEVGDDPEQTTSKPPEVRAGPEQVTASHRDHLFSLAVSSPLEARSAALLALAGSLVDAELLVISDYAKRVAAAGLCPRKDFHDQVRDLQRRRKQAAAIPPPVREENPPTHDELVERWLLAHPLTVYGLGRFRRCQNGVWPPVDDLLIKQEIQAINEQAKSEGLRPTNRILESVFELAMVKTAVRNEDWDQDPNLLAMTNGVLNVNTLELMPHDPEYHLTSGLDFPYDPAAAAPRFEAMLDRLIPEAKDFILEYGGYCLTHYTHHEICVFFCGPPASGKSTILESVRSMFGARAGVLSVGDLDRSLFSLTHLPGKTLMTATEMPEDFHNANNRLNQLISGECIHIDRKYLQPLEITPTAKYMFAMNEPPRISPGSGLYRRIVVIQVQPLPEAERDPHLKARLVAERPGMLNLFLKGLHALNARSHFAVPAGARQARDAYQRSNDVVAAFVDECCLCGPQYHVQAAHLYAAYKTWCEANGHRPKSLTALAKDWERLGFKRRPNTRFRIWDGLGLIAGAP